MGAIAMIVRPPRTDTHQLLAAFLAQFKDAGLVPVISTNGGIPEADIQVVKGAKPGDVLEAWVTNRGKYRLTPPMAFVTETVSEAQFREMFP